MSGLLEALPVETAPRHLALPEPLAGLARLRPIDLDEVLATAELQQRVDRKYLLPTALVDRMLRELGGGLRVLQIDGLRLFAYRSVYFDTPGLAFFRQHVQGRRRRFKVRTREYLDSGLCLLEVKAKDGRGRTVKLRRPHPREHARTLTGPGEVFVAEVMAGAASGARSLARNAVDAATLRPVLDTLYRRATLVHEASGSRITCDVELRCRAGGRERGGQADEVLLETKSRGGQSPVDAWLQAHGIRPHSVSKYCIGIALLYPGVRSNPWRRTLRRHFDQAA